MGVQKGESRIGVKNEVKNWESRIPDSGRQEFTGHSLFSPSCKSDRRLGPSGNLGT